LFRCGQTLFLRLAFAVLLFLGVSVCSARRVPFTDGLVADTAGGTSFWGQRSREPKTRLRAAREHRRRLAQAGGGVARPKVGGELSDPEPPAPRVGCSVSPDDASWRASLAPLGGGGASASWWGFPLPPVPVEGWDQCINFARLVKSKQARRKDASRTVRRPALVRDRSGFERALEAWPDFESRRSWGFALRVGLS